MKIVAFDLGVRGLGTSEWENGKPRAWYYLHRTKDYGLYLGKLYKLALGADYWILEDLYAPVHKVMGSRGMNRVQQIKIVSRIAASVIDVAKVYGEVELIGIQADCETYSYLAAEWQSIFKMKRIIEAFGIKIMPGETKKASRKLASKIVGEEVRNDNIADAICLAYKWHFDRHIFYKGEENA